MTSIHYNRIPAFYNQSLKTIFSAILIFLLSVSPILAQKVVDTAQPFVTYIANPHQQSVKLYWKNDSNGIFKSILNLKNWLTKNNSTLVFAMNAGMYTQSNAPLGLYIENHKQITVLNTKTGHGNFYLKPNGVFYLTADNKPFIATSDKFVANGNIKYATQSGPMLVINGKIHPALKKGSANLNIRNGVGILPDNTILFAMSKTAISFYDFANYFKKMGCRNALYLDGFVSRTYLPEKNWIQTDGNFGVIIGVTKIKNRN
ncbi:phosphodiester glycosidase family protein [Polluticaenibacter yanchengensis]|uniref:Phosphodiester glycosidase family protein n=1 Tax=Polluticaenibacter yanchengensis TaxID=3014562 RepID=A0ABT4UJF0_9BACT|nr:phosphodiester glycosidase family protein [Chitinophagaceae bacterium LY-5]